MTERHVREKFHKYPDCPDQHLELCLLAALDAVSTRDVSDLSYATSLIHYRQKKDRFPKGVSLQQMLTLTLEELRRADNFNHAYINLYHSPTVKITQQLLEHARATRERVIGWTSDSHVVGLLPEESPLWRFVGLKVPEPDSLPVDRIHRRLFIPPQTDRPNLIILGPEIKGPNEIIPWNKTGDYKSLQEVQGPFALLRGLKKVATGW